MAGSLHWQELQNPKVKVKLLSRVWLFATPWTYLLGSSVHGIFQARVLEWVAMSFSRGSSWLRDWTQVSCIVGRRLPSEPPGSQQNPKGISIPHFPPVVEEPLAKSPFTWSVMCGKGSLWLNISSHVSLTYICSFYPLNLLLLSLAP